MRVYLFAAVVFLFCSPSELSAKNPCLEVIARVWISAKKALEPKPDPQMLMRLADIFASGLEQRPAVTLNEELARRAYQAIHLLKTTAVELGPMDRSISEQLLTQVKLVSYAIILDFYLLGLASDAWLEESLQILKEPIRDRDFKKWEYAFKAQLRVLRAARINEFLDLRKELFGKVESLREHLERYWSSLEGSAFRQEVLATIDSELEASLVAASSDFERSQILFKMVEDLTSSLMSSPSTPLQTLGRDIESTTVRLRAIKVLKDKDIKAVLATAKLGLPRQRAGRAVD